MKVSYNILVGQASVWQLEFMWTLTGLISQGLADLGSIPEVIFSLRWTISGHFSNTEQKYFFFWHWSKHSSLFLFSVKSEQYILTAAKVIYILGPWQSCTMFFLLNSLINRSCFPLLFLSCRLCPPCRPPPGKPGCSKCSPASRSHWLSNPTSRLPCRVHMLLSSSSTNHSFAVTIPQHSCLIIALRTEITFPGPQTGSSWRAVKGMELKTKVSWDTGHPVCSPKFPWVNECYSSPAWSAPKSNPEEHKRLLLPFSGAVGTVCQPNHTPLTNNDWSQHAENPSEGSFAPVGSSSTVPRPGVAMIYSNWEIAHVGS